MSSRRSYASVAATAAVLVIAAASAGPVMAADPGVAVSTDDYVSMADGVRYQDVKRGTGPEPQPGQTVTVNYTGWLFNDGKRGAKFDSSLDRNEPLSFTIGAGQVIPGWDAGVATMHVGGERILVIPPGLAYGDHGAGTAIPANATLMFDVTLLGAK